MRVVDGRIYARVTFTDKSGARREVHRRAESKSHARRLIREVLRELDSRTEQPVAADKLTFAELADYYESTYLVPPTYVNNRRVSGLRAWKDFQPLLGVLRRHFERRRLRDISYDDLRQFKLLRLKTPTQHGTQRTAATVNRELSMLRRVLNIAVRRGWILANPFGAGDPLICPGDELPRERFLTPSEEARLLAACTGRRAHLRPLVICAVDTGLRRAEMLKLKWADVDWDRRLLKIQAVNTKTLRERKVAMTERLAAVLRELFEERGDGEAVFGIDTTFRSAFTRAKEIAGIEDLHWHDLRHTYATRLVGAHLSLTEVGRLLGHTTPATTYRYSNANAETAIRAADALNALYGQSETAHSKG